MTVSPFEIAEALGLNKPTPEQAEVIAAPAQPRWSSRAPEQARPRPWPRVRVARRERFVSPTRARPRSPSGGRPRGSSRPGARTSAVAGDARLDDVDPTGYRKMAEQTASRWCDLPLVRGPARHRARGPAAGGPRRAVADSAGGVEPAHSGVSTGRATSSGSAGHHHRVPARWRQSWASTWDAGSVGAHAPEFRAGQKAEAARASGTRRRRSARERAAGRLPIAILPLLKRTSSASAGSRDGLGIHMLLAAQPPRPTRCPPANGATAPYCWIEYQDTGTRRSPVAAVLFGDGEPTPVTAVGDPCAGRSTAGAAPVPAT